MFASLAINPAGADGSVALVLKQVAAAGDHVRVRVRRDDSSILRVVDRVVGLRVSSDDEETGIDLTEHGEIAYLFRERDRSPGRGTADLSEDELVALQERLVVRAAERVLASIRPEAPTDPAIVRIDEPASPTARERVRIAVPDPLD